MQLEQITKEINNLSLENLCELKKVIMENIESKTEKKKSIYKHECFGSSNYHFSKYKHYAKALTQIDDSKTNGYAFIGQFLKVNEENLVNDGSYIVEVCWGKYSLYKIEGNEKKLLLKGNQSQLVSFIRSVKEITGL